MMVKLLLCVSVLVLLLAPAESRSYSCCTQYHEKPVALKKLKFYVIQEDTGYCNIRAVIFKTTSKPLCANPETGWVKEAMKTVPRKPRKA